MVYARQSSHSQHGSRHRHAGTAPAALRAHAVSHGGGGFPAAFGSFPLTISDGDYDFWRSQLGMSGSAATHAPEETSFTAAEGPYQLTDEVKPPVLHSQIANSPNLYPSRLTTITVTFSGKQATQGIAALLRRHKDADDKEKEVERDEKLGLQKDGADKETDDSVSEGENAESESEGLGTAGSDTPQQPSTPGLFSPTIAPVSGKKKPASRVTHNIRSTSSSFVTRIHTMEGLNKHLSAKSGDTTFVFYNGGKSFYWYEIGGVMKEPVARVTFAAFPTCHDINRHTSTSENLDLLIGFNTGDIMWFDPLSSRYVRINKGGCMSTSPITCVRWVPGHKSMFLASMADGTIMVYDKERDDGQFSVSPPGEPGGASESWNALEEMIVTRPVPAPPGKGEKTDKVKNPVSHWRLCRRAITDFQFSPDMRHLASTSEDGCLRIIDPSAEKLIETYSSYFGSLTCVSWTPDSRHLIIGGQDDLVSVFSLREQKLLARCQGHSSFVVSVAVDPVRSDGRAFRFGSVGEDKQLVLWDFAPPPGRARTQTLNRTPTGALSPKGLANEKPAEAPSTRYHPAPPRALIPVIHPSMIVALQGEILSSLAFVPHFVLTITRPGFLKSWQRPTERTVDMTAEKNALFARAGEPPAREPTGGGGGA